MPRPPHPHSPSPGRHTALRKTLVPVALGALLAGTLGTGSATAAQEDDPGLVRVSGAETAADRTEIAGTGVSIDLVEEDGTLLATATPDDVDEITELGYGVDSVQLPAEAMHPDPGYTSYPEVVEQVDALAAEYPDLVHTEVYGQSYEGRDLVAVRISDDAAVDQDRPEVLFTHSQHAREPLTVEMALHIMEMLTEGHGSDEQITELLETREIWVLPNTNPDGTEFDQSEDAWQDWRKTREPNEGSDALGTDMNRNWAYNWGCCNGSSDDPESITYRGHAPESATEVEALADFVRGREADGEQQITTAIDFHTFGELVLWPFGHTYDEVTDGMIQDEYDTHQALGELMAESNGYTPQQSSDLYITDGSINDWLWADQGIVNFTFEMYPSSMDDGGFYPPSDVIEEETARNEEPVLDLLGYADCPYRIIGEEETYCG
ncbi:zinc carboxypeptidase [Nocardiopsis sp. HNM0947]|uniref:Zinc carboxypeptidase n=1 Tax=Nocardiopsis coralli TaxID=2772213 RepID=A0ABR9PCX0_9ACTN|nr:M14 family metallopeptidase [Nocardiopsis coralli]MBE3001659.1 zinc carboxypeptidase [Nocardiopsis coralli]